MDAFEAELHAAALRGSDEFRVLRRLKPRTYCERPLGPWAKIGLIVDVETTGTEEAAHLIEVGFLKFAYSPAGTIIGSLGQRQAFHQPDIPILPFITRLTGISDETVRGHKLDVEALQAFAKDASIVIAHNAAFDRRHIERVLPIFETLPWACSQTMIPWSEEGVESAKLTIIANRLGFFYTGHRSIDDAFALLEVLDQPLPRSGRIVMSELLKASSQPTARVYALGLPYSLRDEVRARGYKWSTGDDGKPRAWHRDVQADAVDAELTFLDTLDSAGVLEPLVLELNAYTRFSSRLR